MGRAVTTGEASKFKKILSGKRSRNLREYLTAYLMIAPAITLIFVFGIFPVGFALYVSLHKWRLKQGDFLGLTNYFKAINNFTYVFAFALAIGLLIGGFLMLRRLQRQFVENNQPAWKMAIPGALYAATIVAFFRYLWFQLPEFLGIADKIIGKEKTTELFIQLLGEAFRAETVSAAWQTFVVLGAVAIFTGLLFHRFWPSPQNLDYQVLLAVTWFAFALGIGLVWFTYSEIAQTYRQALENSTDPGIWPQVITISAGIILLILAWLIYRSASNQEKQSAFWARILASMFLLVGGWLLIGEVPVVVALGDEDMWLGLKVTAYFSLGTVPIQLAIALFLSILLFQKLRGTELFRILFFLPYVTPSVAAAAVFRQLFSTRHSAPANQVLQFLGLEPQEWLREPAGVFALAAEALGFTLPEWAAGPSMALVVIIMLSIWTYVGYDTVIYMAGLGNIPVELTEAAEIDGANKWQVFRHITFPLLSPTTYFLSLIAIIGTFKAFNTIWVLREPLALRTTDTFSVVIFAEFFEKLRYGYASALAFVLFAIILALTLINRRIQGSRVFYG